MRLAALLVLVVLAGCASAPAPGTGTTPTPSDNVDPRCTNGASPWLLEAVRTPGFVPRERMPFSVSQLGRGGVFHHAEGFSNDQGEAWHVEEGALHNISLDEAQVLARRGVFEDDGNITIASAGRLDLATHDFAMVCRQIMRDLVEWQPPAPRGAVADCGGIVLTASLANGTFTRSVECPGYSDQTPPFYAELLNLENGTR